jgi:FkbM family methyltransferase
MPNMLTKLMIKIMNIPTFEKIFTLIYLKIPLITSVFTKRAIKRKYGNLEKLEIKIYDQNLVFSTEDPYSKFWLYLRCSKGNIHEENVTKLLVECLKDTKCFVDVGANIGYYSVLASKIASNAVIYSFEMDASNYTILNKNLTLNNCINANMYQVAVSDINGIVGYIGDPSNPSPMYSLSNFASQDSSKNAISVKAITLDDFFIDKKLIPDLIKIDVEGAELKVLRGMHHLLEQGNIKFFIEIHPILLFLKFKSSVEEVLTILFENGYSVFEISDMRGKGKTFNLKKLDRRSRFLYNTMLYAYKK